MNTKDNTPVPKKEKSKPSATESVSRIFCFMEFAAVLVLTLLCFYWVASTDAVKGMHAVILWLAMIIFVASIFTPALNFITSGSRQLAETPKQFLEIARMWLFLLAFGFLATPKSPFLLIVLPSTILLTHLWLARDSARRLLTKTKEPPQEG